MTSNYSVIRAVVIFAEHLFDGEALLFFEVFVAEASPKP